jgi:hypothetical protein
MTFVGSGNLRRRLRRAPAFNFGIRTARVIGRHAGQSVWLVELAGGATRLVNAGGWE